MCLRVMWFACPMQGCVRACVDVCMCGVEHVGVVGGFVLFNEGHVAMFRSGGVVSYVPYGYLFPHVIPVKVWNEKYVSLPCFFL